MPNPLPYVCICILLLYINASSAQCPAPVALSITSITTTESRCQSSGTATVVASGGNAPYFYSIIAGPVTTPLQSSNSFQSLSPGNYTVQVTDSCNTSVTRTFSISGNYSLPQVYTSFQVSSCPGSSDGRITVNAMRGRPPFSYALISPSPVTVPSQASNQFTGLPAGTYTCQVSDSCGNFQTRTITLPDGNNGPFYLSRFNMHYQDCDSFSIVYSITPYSFQNFKLPYTATLNLPNGNTLTHVITALNSTNAITDTFHFRYVHPRYQSQRITLNIVNNCGASYSTTYHTGIFNMFTGYTLLPGCSGQYSYTFDTYDNSGTNTSSKLHCNTITYTLVSPSGAILTTQTNNSTFSGYPPGNGYKVVREDCCRRDTQQFNWRTAPDLKINSYWLTPQYVTRDGVTAVALYISPGKTGSIIIAEGPPSVTYSNGTVHTYTYPDTLTNVSFDNVRLQAFTAGTWKVIAMDSCGQKDSITFTINQENLRHDTFTATLKKGCTGANTIVWNSVSNAGTASYYSAFVNTPAASRYQYAYPLSYTDSIINLSPGTYTVNYIYTTSFQNTILLNGMSNSIRDTIPVTINIPSYTQPAFASAPAVAVCGNTRTVALLPDSTTGVFPYQYSITSGSTTTPLQPGNEFSGLSTGTYRFLIADACGNSFSTNYTIDTLRLPNVATTGNTCESGAATLTLPANPYYSYSWQLPNGNIFTGNTLNISPVTQADTGRYLITVNCNINGCTNTQTSAVRLNFCSVATLPLTLLQFNGSRQNNSIVLHWQTADEINTSHFIVERSIDGVHFTPIKRVNASGLPAYTYTATDYQPLPGLLYYRLQMADTDGRKQYSKIISIANKGNDRLSVYPRLISNEASITVSYAATTHRAFIQLTSIDGRVLQTKPVVKGSLQTSINVSMLTKGNYLVTFVQNNIRKTVRVVKL